MPEFTIEQQEAINARGCDLLVSAAAGSGKTTVLVERVMSLIKEGMDIDRILIVTFTRASASDMRYKLKKRLEKLAANDARCLEQYDRLPLATIGTLHSFCASMIREHFETAGVDAAFRIMETAESEALLSSVLDDVMRDHYANDTIDMRALTCGRDAATVKGLVRSLHRFACNRPDKDEWLAKTVDDCDMEDGIKLIRDILLDDARYSLRSALDLYRQALDICDRPDGPDHYAACIENDIDRVTSMLSLEPDELCTALACFTQARPGRGKNGAETLDTVKALREDAKKRLVTAGGRLLPESEIRRDMADVKPSLRALRDMAVALDKALDAEKDERCAYDYSDLEQRALRVMADPRASEEISSRFDAVFVDEYQDISDLQDAIIRKAAAPGSLFMVGDVKQSIYRFRLAEPGLFLERQHSFGDGHGGRLIRLNRNFRSRAAILDFTNKVFAASMHGEDSDLEYTADEMLYPGAKFGGDDPDVEVHLLVTGESEDDDESASDDNAAEAPSSAAEAEGLLVASMVRRLTGSDMYDPSSGETRKISYRDIVVLSRTRSRIAAIRDTLEHEGIPCFADTSGGFTSSMEINHILALLSYIDNGRQDEQLLSAMLSPCFGFAPEDIALIRADEREGALFEAVGKRSGYDDALGRRLSAFIKASARWHLLSRSLPLDEFIDRFLSETGFYAYVGALPGAERRQGNLDLLCVAAAKYNETHYDGLHGFLAGYKTPAAGDYGEAQPLGEGDDVVRLMTVHKSKGLEFPVVIGVQCERDLTRRGGNDGEFRAHKKLGFAVDIHSPEKRTKRTGALSSAIDSVSKLENINEEMRLLYVMMTRASDRLILVGRAKESPSDESALHGKCTSVRGVRSYLDMILPCLSGSTARLYTHHINEFNVSNGAAAGMSPLERLDAILADKSEIPEELSESFTWRYPYAGMVYSPLKLAVTALTRTVTGPVEAPMPERYPEFMRENVSRSMSSGTATHRALSLIELSALRGNTDIAAAVRGELERLKNAGVITPEQAAITQTDTIIRFFSGEYGQRALKADVLKREWAFNMRMMPSETGGMVQGESEIIVQGIIDCCFIEDGKWVLLDYKTDSVKDIDKLYETYAPQLRMYRRALEEISGIPVKQAVLYLLRGDIGIPVD